MEKGVGPDHRIGVVCQQRQTAFDILCGVNLCLRKVGRDDPAKQLHVIRIILDEEEQDLPMPRAAMGYVPSCHDAR